MTKSAAKPSPEQALFEKVQAYRLDPEGFVELVYRWGEKNTPLAQADGPRIWQRGLLRRIRDFVCENEELEIPVVLRDVTGSGHGVGKSAAVSWLAHWFCSTRLGGICNVTANGEEQLRKKTFAEMARWMALAINRHWFDVEGIQITYASWFAKILREQLGLDTNGSGTLGQLWSVDRTEAIQGTHSQVGVMWLVDEASGVPTPVFNAIDPGSFTEKTKSRFMLLFGNVTRNQGEFRDALYVRQDFTKRHIDSREVEGVDRTEADKLVDRLGEDHDQVRVRVKGHEPHTTEENFIPLSFVRGARLRKLEFDRDAPKIIGIDPAPRGGTTSLTVRQGRHLPRRETGNFDKTELIVSWCAKIIDEEDPDAIFCDAGQGSGVIDGLRALGYKVVEVWFGAPADNPLKYFDQRTQMWAAVRDWLPGASLPPDDELEAQLTAPFRELTGKSGTVEKLESKKQMRSRGIPSPDKGDSLALTFAKPVSRKDRRSSRNISRRPKKAKGVDYPVYG